MANISLKNILAILAEVGLMPETTDFVKEKIKQILSDDTLNQKSGLTWWNGITEHFKNSYETIKEHETDFNDTDKKRFTSWTEHKTDIENWFDDQLGTDYGETIIIPENVENSMFLWSKAILKGWVDKPIFVETLPGDDITSPVALLKSLGYESFDNSKNALVDACMLYYLIKEKNQTIVHCKITPNLKKQGAIQSLITDVSRSKSDIFFWLSNEITENIDIYTGYLDDYDKVNEVINKGTFDSLKNDIGNLAQMCAYTYNIDTNYDYVRGMIKGVEQRFDNVWTFTVADPIKEKEIGLNFFPCSPLGAGTPAERKITLPHIASKNGFNNSKFLTECNDYSTAIPQQYFYDRAVPSFSYNSIDATYKQHIATTMTTPDYQTGVPMTENSITHNGTVLYDWDGVSQTDDDWYIQFSELSLKGSLNPRKIIITIVNNPELSDIVESSAIDFVGSGRTQNIDKSMSGDIYKNTPDEEKLKQWIDGKNSASDVLDNSGYIVDTINDKVIGKPDWTIKDAIKDVEENILPPISLPTINTYDFFKVYVPTDSQMKEISGALWTDGFFNAIQKLFTNPIDSIISYHALPIENSMISASPTEFKLGTFKGNFNVNMTNKLTYTIQMGSVQCQEYYKNYIDYEFTTVVLYIPFVGFRKLDTKDVMNHSISLYYSIEILTGSAIATIRVGGKNIVSYPCSMSLEMPITGNNYTRLINSIISTGNDLIGKGMIGAGIDAAVTIAGSLMAPYETERTGNFSTPSGMLDGFRPYLIIGRPKIVGKDYNNVIGYINNEYGSVGDYSGFCQFKEVQLSGCNGATLEEMNEIKSFLNGGIIL